MSAPSPPPYAPQYPAYYPPMTAEGILTKRNVWSANAIGLVAIYVALLISFASGDAIAEGFARFLAASGALLGSALSLAAALGSKRTTDMQNLGLFLWSGFLWVAATFVIGLI